ncbi:MAG TPA: FkbM family methyltransferase [Burkholderiales bacterium]
MKKGAVLDVGVNVGLYLVKLRALDPRRAYIGFEPNPFCNYYVQELIRANRFANTQILPVALSVENKIGKLLASSRDDGGASILEDIKAGQDVSFSVDTLFYRGDDLVPQLVTEDGVGIVKIDAEGAEGEVIDGLRHTIRTHRPIIYCEILTHFVDATKTRRRAAEELWSKLNDLNYRVLGVLWDASLRELRTTAELGEPFSGEYILVHADDTAELMRAFEAERGIPISKHKGL